MRLVFLCFIVSTIYSQTQGEKFQLYYMEAGRAYEKKNYDSAAYFFSRANEIRPNTHSVQYNLAAMLSLTGKTKESAGVLKEDFWLQANNAFLKDSHFVNVWNDPVTNELKAEIDNWKIPISNSKKVFELDDRGFHPEGIAYDKQTNRFFIGSIRKKCIWIHQDGRVDKSFFQNDSLYAVMGLRVDELARKLWVCTSVMPEMENYHPSLDGLAAVCRFDLDNGKLEKIYRAGGNHIFGDLVIARNGDVFVSDSKSPAIYRIDKKTDRMELWVIMDNGWNLQGLDFSEDGKFLFAADYISGIHKIGISARDITQVKTGKPLRGIDGFYRFGNDFIVTQNGTNPLRVTRLRMDESQTRVMDVEFLEKATPILGEPTLGVIVGDEFYYVANSPWGAYDNTGKFLEEKAEMPAIYKIRVKLENNNR